MERMIGQRVELKDLVGEHELSGVDRGVLRLAPDNRYWEDNANALLFVLDDVAYRAVEDPQDGYRSCLNSIEVVDASLLTTRFKPHRVVVSYIDKDVDPADLLRFTDVVTGAVVLEVGTRNTEDYYPWFVAEYDPTGLAANKPQTRR
jgi:hypothetical protein